MKKLRNMFDLITLKVYHTLFVKIASWGGIQTSVVINRLAKCDEFHIVHVYTVYYLANGFCEPKILKCIYCEKCQLLNKNHRSLHQCKNRFFGEP